MQIEAMGFVRSVVSPIDRGQSNRGKGFASVLSGLKQTESVGNERLRENNQNQELSKEELSELKQILNSVDQSNVDNSSEKIELMKENLQLNDEAVTSTLIAFLNGLKSGKGKVTTSLSEEELIKIMSDLPKMDDNEALIAFVAILPFLDLDEITIETDQNFADLARTIKFFELLSMDNKSGNQQKLQAFLQKLVENLEASLKETTLLNKNEFLHKLFTPLVNELNEQTLKSHHPQSASLTEQLDTMESENTVVNQNNKLNGQILSFQQMDKPYQLTLTQSSQSGKQVSADQLIQQFETILSKSQLLNFGGNQKLFIKLYPEHLGALRVELIQKDATLMAKFMTTTAHAKEILESQIQSLKQAFSSQNIQIERIEVSQQLNQQERYFNRDSQQQQEQRQQEEADEQKQQKDQSFTISFEEELLNIEV
jgi:flagellar hook-length control protein FliK